MIRKVPEDFNLVDALSEWRREILLTFNCHAVARVESFNSSEQTITASLLYPQLFFEHEQAGRYRKRLIDYPLLVDCPLAVPKGSGFALKIPPRAGDECIILFNDRSLDQWFISGQKRELDSNRAHSISDGIAIVGVSSKANSLDGFEEGRAVLGDGKDDIKIGGGIDIVSSEKISIQNSSESLKSVLDALADAINMVPMAAGAATPAKAKINALLE